MADDQVDLAFFQPVQGMVAVRGYARQPRLVALGIAADQGKRGRRVGGSGNYDNPHFAAARDTVGAARHIARQPVAGGEHE